MCALLLFIVLLIVNLNLLAEFWAKKPPENSPESSFLWVLGKKKTQQKVKKFNTETV